MCHVLHHEVGGFLIATPAYLDDGHAFPRDLETVWVEPRSVPQLDLAGLLPFWDLKRIVEYRRFFFRTHVLLRSTSVGLPGNRVPPQIH